MHFGQRPSESWLFCLRLNTRNIFQMGRGEWSLVWLTIYSALGYTVEAALVTTPELLVGF